MQYLSLYARRAAGPIALAFVLGGTGAQVTAATPAPRVVPVAVTFDLTPAQIAASCKQQIAIAKRRLDALVKQRSAPTFHSFIGQIETIETDLSDNTAAQTYLFNVATDPKVRDASEQCGIDEGSFSADQNARPELYRGMIAARASHTARTPPELKLQDLYIIGAQRSGAGLPPAKRAEFIALQKKLNDLANQFAANLGNDNSSVTITAAQATSLPPDFTATLKKDDSGALTVPVNEATYFPFMANESDESARQAYYMAYQNRGGQKNVALLQAAVVARDRTANLLGFPNWEAYVTADHMVGTPAHVASFLSNLDTALLPTAREQRMGLATLKGSTLNAWDVVYYNNQLLKTKYAVDRDAVKQYFPAQHTIDAVLAIYSHLLGLTFAKAPALPKWNSDIVAYNVTDTKTGALRGTFYLDLYPRPGKFAHFANIPMIARRVMPDGTIRPVLNSIVGNWPMPAPGKPSLLSHDDVVTFFHEFGHNVAALCADTPYASLNEGFRIDFIEAPSQMLENFVWNTQILKQISSNVDTGAPLPDDLIAKLQASRYVNEAYSTIGQVFYATVDYRYHTQPPPVDTTAVWRTAVSELTPNVFVDGTIPQAGFTHLMNGYEGSYYGYLYSKVYAQDMFQAFLAGGLENPVEGARYRNDILAPARLEEPDVEVTKFLGRPMSPKAFYQELGIAVPH